MIVKLTHANFKRPVFINKQNISWFYESAADKCTHVVMKGQLGPIGVSESVEQVVQLLNNDCVTGSQQTTERKPTDGNA